MGERSVGLYRKVYELVCREPGIRIDQVCRVLWVQESEVRAVFGHCDPFFFVDRFEKVYPR